MKKRKKQRTKLKIMLKKYLRELMKAKIVSELREWWNEPTKVIKGNKVIAYGEILVMDESFGVRITEVVE